MNATSTEPTILKPTTCTKCAGRGCQHCNHHGVLARIRYGTRVLVDQMPATATWTLQERRFAESVRRAASFNVVQLEMNPMPVMGVA